jgi:hypothetical protein
VAVEAVLGTGAVAEAVPPVAELYHTKLLPVAGVAVRADAVAFWHNVIGDVTVGPVLGAGTMFTATIVLIEYSQPVLLACVA